LIAKLEDIIEARIEARDPSTPPERLFAITQSGDHEIREAAAYNPNAPLALLYELWREFPGGYFENPVVPLLQVSDPRLVLNMPADTLIAVISQRLASPGLLERASRHRQREVRQAVARHPNSPPEILVQMGRGYYFYEDVAANPGTPAAYLEELQIHPWVSVRLALCDNAALPEAVRARLLEDEEPAVRARAAGHW